MVQADTVKVVIFILVNRKPWSDLTRHSQCDFGLTEKIIIIHSVQHLDNLISGQRRGPLRFALDLTFQLPQAAPGYSITERARHSLKNVQLFEPGPPSPHSRMVCSNLHTVLLWTGFNKGGGVIRAGLPICLFG